MSEFKVMLLMAYVNQGCNTYALNMSHVRSVSIGGLKAGKRYVSMYSYSLIIIPYP